MRALILAIVAVMSAADLFAAAPPKKSMTQVRAVIWWSNLGRVSDGGGPAMKPRTDLITDAKTFSTIWTKCGLAAPVPQIDFADNFVVVAFRPSGIDFTWGGLAVDGKGEAKVHGMPAHWTQTNAGWYSSTIAVFSRKGVVKVEGHKLPAAK